MKKNITNATNAMCRLNAFATVINVLEGGVLPGGDAQSDRTAQRVIDLCKEQIQKELRKHDTAMERALKGKP